MDGSFPKKIVQSVYYIQRLAIDHQGSRLYWSNSATSEGIKSCNLSGGNAKTVLNVDAKGFGIHEGDIYWVDYNQQRIQVAKNGSESDVKTVVNGSSISNLKIMDVGSQPAGLDNPCEGQPCSHICVLALSKFSCLCPQGFELDDDQRACKNIDAKAVWWSKNQGTTQIQIFSLNSSQFITIPLEGTPGGLTYDGAGAKLYWSYKRRDAVYRSNLDGSERKLVFRTGGASVTALAYDWIAQNLYYTDNVLGRVGICGFNTSICTTIAQNDGWEPEQIALSPRAGKIYWLDGASNSIMTSLLNGSSVSVYEQRGYCSSISIDQYLMENYYPRIYLASSVDQKIWRSRYDPSSLLESGGSPRGLDCRYNQLYWTEYNSAIRQSFVKTGIYYEPNFFEPGAVRTISPQTLVSSDIGQLWGEIVVVSPNGQPSNRENHCAMKSCSHICALNDKGSSCLCPSDLEIGEDGLTCKKQGE